MKELYLVDEAISNQSSYHFGQVVSLDASIFHLWRGLYTNDTFVSYTCHALLAMRLPRSFSPIEVANPDLDGMCHDRAT